MTGKRDRKSVCKNIERYSGNSIEIESEREREREGGGGNAYERKKEERQKI